MAGVLQPQPIVPQPPLMQGQVQAEQQLQQQQAAFIPYPKIKAIPNPNLRMRAVVWRNRKLLEVVRSHPHYLASPPPRHGRLTFLVRESYKLLRSQSLAMPLFASPHRQFVALI